MDEQIKKKLTVEMAESIHQLRKGNPIDGVEEIIKKRKAREQELKKYATGYGKMKKNKKKQKISLLKKSKNDLVKTVPKSKKAPKDIKEIKEKDRYNSLINSKLDSQKKLEKLEKARKKRIAYLGSQSKDQVKNKFDKIKNVNQREVLKKVPANKILEIKEEPKEEVKESEEEKKKLKEASSLKRYFVRVLGVKIDAITNKQLNLILKQFLASKNQYFLATVNAEYIMESLYNEHFKKILEFSDINTADGIGLIWASKFLALPIKNNPGVNRLERAKKRKYLALWQAFYTLLSIFFFPRYLKTEIPERITGSKVIENLIKLTKTGDHSIFLLGGKRGIANLAKREIEKQYPDVLIVGARSGYLKENEDETSLRKAVNKAKPDILIVALGSPKQEEWIFNNMDKMPSVKIAVGVGGALDFISKAKRRAPLWMRNRGIEWVFRFVLEPWRFPRIQRATFSFIKEVINYKIKNLKS